MPNGQVYIGRAFETKALRLFDGKVEVLEAGTRVPEGARVVDAAGKKAVPGFIDIHTHGAVGVDVNGATAGAKAATHTFNAMGLFHQHRPAIMGAVLELDVFCEMICDGRHLHPGSVRLPIKTKGLDKVVGITDSIMAADLPGGNYHLGVNEVVVEDGDAKLASTGVRAGSTLTQDAALRNLLAFTGRPMEELLPSLTENPVRLIGVFDRKGSIANGKDADLVVLDENNHVDMVFTRGRLLEK